MTAADRLREEARAAALAEALDKARSLALQLLALRFGKLDDDVRVQVSAFDIDRLDALNVELADPAFEPTTVDAALAPLAE